MEGRNEELVKLYQEGNKQALDELLESNRGIINKLANKYMRATDKLEFDDLFNSGVIGLIEAAKRYDFNNEKKAKFITYAIHYINRCINSCVNGHSSKDIENNKFYNSTISLNVPVGEDEGNTELLNTVKDIDYSYEDIEYKIYLKQLRNGIEQTMMDNLTLQQRELLKFRYGWNTKPMTLQEIGDIFNVTRSKVRQWESQALRDLRKSQWCKTKGREFAKDLMGVISSTSYKSVEWGIDFMEKYFKDVI